MLLAVLAADNLAMIPPALVDAAIATLVPSIGSADFSLIFYHFF